MYVTDDVNWVDLRDVPSGHWSIIFSVGHSKSIIPALTCLPNKLELLLLLFKKGFVLFTGVSRLPLFGLEVVGPGELVFLEELLQRAIFSL